MKKILLLVLSICQLGMAAQKNDALFIDPAGNVGIGTDTPKGTLDVQGDSYINGNLIVGDTDNTSTTLQVNGQVKVDENLKVSKVASISDGLNLGSKQSDGSFEVSFDIKKGGWSIWSSGANPESGHRPGTLEFWSSYDGLYLMPRFVMHTGSKSLPMILDSLGNLKLPGNLKVVDIYARNVYSNNKSMNNIFDDVNELKPLSELREFTTKEKHLPGIPPIGEWVDQKMTVDQLQVLNLEKIQELTLYLLEMDREHKNIIDGLQNKIEKLEKQIQEKGP